MPDPYILMLFVVGALVALVAWLPLVFRRAPLSLPIVCVGLGAALFSLPQVGFDPLPQTYPEITERLTEFVVIIALMGAGLKIDRIFNPRRWGVTWRLLGVTMMLSVAVITLLGWSGIIAFFAFAIVAAAFGAWRARGQHITWPVATIEADGFTATALPNAAGDLFGDLEGRSRRVAWPEVRSIEPPLPGENDFTVDIGERHPLRLPAAAKAEDGRTLYPALAGAWQAWRMPAEPGSQPEPT